MSAKPRKFVLLPSRGLSADSSGLAASTASFFRSLMPVAAHGAPPAAGAATAGGLQIRVLDSIRESGAKLVEMSEEDAERLHHLQPDVQVAPVLYYALARAERFELRAAPSLLDATQPPGTVEVIVKDKVSNSGVPGVTVVAFTDFEQRFGAGGETDGDGRVSLDFGVTPVSIERLYVYPPLAGYWGTFGRDVQLQGSHTVEIEPIDLGFTDSVRHFHNSGQPTDGAGVTVAVVDTGVGPHADLTNATGDIDNGDGHGSHVAGIIAGRGNSPSGLAGVAPGADIRSYRVFSVPGGLSANFTIAKAIDQAVLDGCDLINLSLKIDRRDDPSGFLVDPVVQLAMEDARQAGVLPIAAAGNDGRTAVDFPARDPMALAVSAVGRIGTFPGGSTEEADVLEPFGADPNDFIAAFSNIGPQVDLAGPGVGVISTVPGGYGVMSGTSMACPAVAGMVARLLAQNPAILNAKRDSARSTEIARMAQQAAGSLGFPANLEGGGDDRPGRRARNGVGSTA